MKRVLLLTYYVPPRAAIASVRVGQMMRTLPNLGWEVVPVTPDIGDGIRYSGDVRTTAVMDFKEPVRRMLGVKRTQSTHERFGLESGGVATTVPIKQRAIQLGYELSEYMNRSFGWIGPGSRAISEILARERFDAVISTSPPEVTHIVASRVHGDVPWIADFRDPWLRSGLRAAPLVAIDRILERHTLRGAAAITTVSEPLAELFRKRYPNVPVHVILNAYSESDWRDVPFEASAKATFVYAGQLYSGRRDPGPLFEAVSQLLRDRLITPDELSIDFYGPSNDWLHSDIRRFGIGAVVRLHPQLPRGEILKIERSAARLLMLLWNNENEAGTYTGKLFEYLGARRPILAVGGPERSVVDDVLAATGAGTRARTVPALRDAVLQTVVEFRNGGAREVPQGRAAEFESTRLGERFAEVLDRVTS